MDQTLLSLPDQATSPSLCDEIFCADFLIDQWRGEFEQKVAKITKAKSPREDSRLGVAVAFRIFTAIFLRSRRSLIFERSIGCEKMHV
jgi:hypothetical protein